MDLLYFKNLNIIKKMRRNLRIYNIKMVNIRKNLKGNQLIKICHSKINKIKVIMQNKKIIRNYIIIMEATKIIQKRKMTANNLKIVKKEAYL